MTQEDKDLLLKDICARLLYKIKAQYYDKANEYENYDIIEGIVINTPNPTVDIGQYALPVEEVKPYLFPLSSMTEKQIEEWQSLMIRDSYGILYHTIDSFDYLYKNHIDIRGLIKKGLAIDATNKNIY